jgi:hypothetical protein
LHRIDLSKKELFMTGSRGAVGQMFYTVGGREEKREK